MVLEQAMTNPTMIILEDGRRMALMDKTRPVAKHTYICAWSNDHPHMIRAGETYVRAVYKIDDGELQSDHVCLTCWCGVPEQ